jgi:ribose transport system substrate-binding protein
MPPVPMVNKNVDSRPAPELQKEIQVKAKILTGAVLAATVLALAACSSSGGAAKSSTPASAASAGASTSGAVAAAEAYTKAATTFSTTIPVTGALPSAPPKGKTVVFLQCEQQECGEEGQGIDAAAAAVGWKVKTLNFKAADPATLVAALTTALQYKPVGVFFSGSPQVTWKSVQPAYAAAHAFITENFDSTAPTGPGVLAGRGYGNDSTHIGKLLADAQIANSLGKPANSLLVSVPDYAVFVPTATEYHSEIAAVCPTCKITDVNATLPQLLGGQLIPAVISAAKRATNIKYIVSVNGAFTAQLPAALKAAGLGGKFQIISGQGSSLDQESVLNGEQLATVNSPLVMGGWQDMDMAIRTVMGLPIPAGDHVVPIALLTKANIGTPKDSYDIPSNYAAQFKTLWKVGS